MDSNFETYLADEKKDLIQDCKYRAKLETWLNRAYARMLLDQKLLSEEDYKSIDRGLIQALDAVTEQDILAAPHGQDIYFLYEQALYRQIGMDTACKLHVGRSRNDIYFTEFRMSLREAVWQLAEEILALQQELETYAADGLETVIPYYTYGQPSQPGTWGHYLMGIHACLENDMSRLHHAYETINRCPMGAGAGIGSAFPLDKYRLAQLLGFDGVIENTTIANSAVDYYLELESAMAILNTTLNRVGGDLDFFASMECGILDGDSSICGGSSIMPQKKNYEMGAFLRVHATPMYGSLLNALVSGGSVSMFPIYETFSYFREFWASVDKTVTCIRGLRVALEHSKIREDVALRRARDGFTAATHMAEQLTMEVGEPFVKTHHIVGNMIHTLMDEDRLRPENMTPELMREAAIKAIGFPVERTQAQIDAMLDPLSSLNAKVTGGTPKPADTQKLLEAGRTARLENEQWLEQIRQQCTDAYAQVNNIHA